MTPNQKLVLNVIIQAIQAQGFPPTIKEIADKTLLSKSQVSQILRSLESAKVISRQRRKPRAIKLMNVVIKVEVVK